MCDMSKEVPTSLKLVILNVQNIPMYDICVSEFDKTGKVVAEV